MTYQPMHYDIWVKPIFVKDNGIEYPFEGLSEHEKIYRGQNYEFRFIANTLRHYFGDNLDFEDNENQIKIKKLSDSQMKILGNIYEDTCEFPVKYERSHLKFQISIYTYDAPLCKCPMVCECNE